MIYRIPVFISCNIPYTRFKKPLYTVYPKPLADPGISMLPTYSLKTNTLTLLFLFRFEINEFPLITTKFHEKSMLGFICTELPKKIFILELFYLQLFTLIKICAGKFLHLIPGLYIQVRHNILKVSCHTSKQFRHGVFQSVSIDVGIKHLF